jgi:hypothetical protein
MYGPTQAALLAAAARAGAAMHGTAAADSVEGPENATLLHCLLTLRQKAPVQVTNHPNQLQAVPPSKASAG